MGEGVKVQSSLPTYSYKVQLLVHALMLSGNAATASNLRCVYPQQRGICEKGENKKGEREKENIRKKG
jgi:hypothetical protein